MARSSCISCPCLETEPGSAPLGSDKVFYSIPLLVTSPLHQTQTTDLLVFLCQRRSSCRYLPYANLHSQVKSTATDRCQGPLQVSEDLSSILVMNPCNKTTLASFFPSIFRMKRICKGKTFFFFIITFASTHRQYDRTEAAPGGADVTVLSTVNLSPFW